MSAIEELRKLVEAVEKWDDEEEPDDLKMIDACTKARAFLDMQFAAGDTNKGGKDGNVS